MIALWPLTSDSKDRKVQLLEIWTAVWYSALLTITVKTIAEKLLLFLYEI